MGADEPVEVVPCAVLCLPPFLARLVWVLVWRWRGRFRLGLLPGLAGQGIDCAVEGRKKGHLGGEVVEEVRRGGVDAREGGEGRDGAVGADGVGEGDGGLGSRCVSILWGRGSVMWRCLGRRWASGLDLGDCGGGVGFDGCSDRCFDGRGLSVWAGHDVGWSGGRFLRFLR